MEFQSLEHPAVRIVRFEGDMGLADNGDLKKLFVELREAGDLQIVLDLNNVSFLDSTVLGTLVWALKNMREAGGDVRLCGLQGFVHHLFEMTGLDLAFRVFEGCEEAVASFSARG